MPFRSAQNASLTPELQSLIAAKLAALRTEAGLGTILDGIGEGFYAVDRDWRLILFNSEAAKHFRCKPEDVLGRVLWDAFPGTRDTGLARLFHRVMASRETIRSETESIVVKGRWMAYRLFPLGDGLGVVFRDTTDRRIAEEQRDLLIKEMEHRVKNTLTTVQSIASQSFRAAGIAPEALRAFDARLIALGNVHGVLTQQH
jgi:signal transduction histidine kinase